MMRKAIQGKVKGLVQNQFKKPVITMEEKEDIKGEEEIPDPVEEGAEEAEAELTEEATD